MFASTATESLSETHRRPYETVAAPDQVPLYDLVPVKGPEGEPLDSYRGVRRRDTSEIVSVVSSRHQLVQHREVAEAVHAIGEALERPVADATAPTFPREVIRLFGGVAGWRSASSWGPGTNSARGSPSPRGSA